MIKMLKEENLGILKEKEDQKELNKQINQILLEAIEGLSLQLATMEAKIEALEKK